MKTKTMIIYAVKSTSSGHYMGFFETREQAIESCKLTYSESDLNWRYHLAVLEVEVKNFVDHM